MGHLFQVENMKCMGCVANAKQAIEALEGVNGVEIDLASKTAKVEGPVDPQQVVEAVSAAGYPTSLKESP